MFNIYVNTHHSFIRPKHFGYSIVITNPEFNVYKEIYGGGTINSSDREAQHLALFLYAIETTMKYYPNTMYPNETLKIHSPFFTITKNINSENYKDWIQNSQTKNLNLWQQLVDKFRFQNIKFVNTGNIKLIHRARQLSKIGFSSPRSN